ncbi:hypothetical protein FRC06_009615 [Ceratobasidium sp. 370]|nr:hypothetical protein FRC06_009615 [Ceratobasidium sp. 370]
MSESSLSTVLSLPSGKKLTVPTGLFINNQFVPSVTGETIRTTNPSTEEVICTVQAASAKDIDLAVKAAREAFNTTWGKHVPGTKRAALIHKLADLMERDAQSLAELESLDNGKPVGVALEGDIAESVGCLRYYAGWADKNHGQTIEVNDDTKMAYTRHEPVGVCGQIIPWNYPIMMWAWKTAPALACGCTIVMKPSELTPLTALKLCELVVEAGNQVMSLVFADTTSKMKIVQEEIFGPVLSVSKFDTEEEVIALANDTTYGLGAGLHSNDANQIHRVVNALDAGTVWVNQYNILHNNVPFGGYKQSGIGRELGSYALKEYTNVKAVHWNFGEKMGVDNMSGLNAEERQALLAGNDDDRVVREYGTASSSGTSTPSLKKSSAINNPSRTDLLWILGGLWSAVFLGALDTTIVATLLSPIGSHFQKSHQASYLGTSYLLSVCCFTPLYGRLSDILGRKGAMLLALSLFGLGTLLCGLAGSMEFLIFARAIAGMGGGGVMTVSSISTTDLIPLKQRGLYQGLANILFGLGAGIGGPLGGWINDTVGWRAAFLIQIPILVLSAIVITLKVNIKLPDSKQTTRQKLARIDYAGSFTLVICVGCLLLGLSLKTSEDLAWDSGFVIGLLCASGVFAIAFVYAEARLAPEPIMPLRLLSQRTPLAVALSNFGTSCNAFSTLYNVPLYFSAVRLKSAADSGLHLLPNAVAVSCGSVFAGWMMRRTGKLYYLTLASALGMLLSSLLIATWDDNSAEYHLWGDIVFGGLGGSSLITCTLIALIASVDKKDYAVATGMSYLFRTTGQVLGVSLSGALVQAILVSSLRKGITGPGSEEIIQRIRHSTAVIPTLEAPLRDVAVQSYQKALRSVFIGQAVLSFLTFLCCLPIEENPLP